jgi:hypothetical protein
MTALSAVGSSIPQLRPLIDRFDGLQNVKAAEAILVEEIQTLSRAAPELIGPDLMAVSITMDRMPPTVTCGYLPLSDAGWAIHRMGEVETAGSFSPWVVTSGRVAGPQLMTGMSPAGPIGDLTVRFEGVPRPKPVRVGPNRYRLTVGVSRQPRRAP